MATNARSASKPRIVKLGTREVEFPSPYLQELKDSNHLLGDVELLRQEFHNQGYLFIRGLHSREEVLDARLAVLRYIKDLGEDKLSTEYPLEDGVLNPRCGKGCVPFMEGKNNITHSDPVRKVIEGRRPFQFFKTLIGAEPKTFDFKWLRAIHREGYTGVHTDYVYMSRGTHQLYTMWTPIGDVTLEMGTLCVCEGSHRLPGFKHFQETYGSCDIEKANLVGTGWFTNDPYEITGKFGGQWKTADFKAGDVLIFGLRTVHMSTVNTTHFARISCDTRWQAAHLDFDPRYVGDIGEVDVKYGLYTEDNKKIQGIVTMEKLKSMWGFN